MRQIALGIIVTGLITTSAWAQEPARTRLVTDGALAGLSLATSALTQTAPAPEEPAAKKVTVLAGADFPSVYFFRGIRQEVDPAFTFQPFVDVGVAASDTVTLNIGSWNSVHGGSNKDDYDGAFYESDFYASASFAAGKISPKVLYTAYMSPADAFSTVHELAIILPFDDSSSAVPLAPTVMVATELGDAGADGIGDGSTYLELGVTPAIPMADEAPVSISIPVKLGMSLKDYYGDDATFGYFSAGVLVGVPVNEMFEVHGGVTVLALGDSLKAINNDKSSQVIASVGFGVTF